jgi:ribosomal protein L11 methyltransferase
VTLVTMPFVQLTLCVGAADPESFEDALLAAGALSITLEDAADDPVLEPAPGTTPLWPSVKIKALFDAGSDPQVIQALLLSQLSQPLPSLEFDEIADRPWEREWLKDFRPMRFGRRLWICPDGQRPEETNGGQRTADGADARHASAPQLPVPSLPPVFIDLDPGLAFGTGTHATTALCLAWLDGADLRGKTVLDYGCGSGILAIAALKLGAESALCVDIDPQAVTATLDNAARNDVARRLEASSVEHMRTAPVDIVLANILAEPLLDLAPTLAALVKPGGAIVLSGVLHDQATPVATRYAPWFDIAPVSVRDGWARVDGRRK